jgi:hypothetical protein
MGLLDKVKETGQKAAEKAKEGVKAGQEKVEEVKLERKLKDLKSELGGITYAQRTGAAEGDQEAEIVRIVAEITATQAEIDQLDED